MPMSLILASRSPRRIELLSMIGTAFEVCAADIDEGALVRKPGGGGTQPIAAEETARALALGKARQVAASHPGEVVLGSDTVVVLENKILGKPRDAGEARTMLRALCGKIHQVLTAVALVQDGREMVFCSSAEVHFYPADDALDAFIERYVASGSPLDKAGAYGIQDEGALLIQKINGDYYTVMGLPVAEVWRRLREFAPDLFAG